MHIKLTLDDVKETSRTIPLENLTVWDIAIAGKTMRETVNALEEANIIVLQIGDDCITLKNKYGTRHTIACSKLYE